jgi:hypothetical protein
LLLLTGLPVSYCICRASQIYTKLFLPNINAFLPSCKKLFILAQRFLLAKGLMGYFAERMFFAKTKKGNK